MHSPQCPGAKFAMLVAPAPQQGEQTTIPAGSKDFDFGWADAANAFAITCKSARVRLQEPGSKPVYFYCSDAAPLMVIVPWTKLRVYVDELTGAQGVDAYGWILTLEKLEPPTDR